MEYFKSFEDLTKEELYEIIKLRVDIFIVEQNCPYPELDRKDYKAIHHFIKENSEIVAYLRILPKGVSYNEVSIGRFIVKEDKRGRGLAKKILQNAIDFVEKEMNETSIRLSGQKYLEKFYNSFKFDTVSDVYLEDDIPHVEMLYNKRGR
ncbi:MAG: GNAT family N-acetyltransferase [Thermotogota bacterium]